MDVSDRPMVTDIQGDNYFSELAKKNWLQTSKPITKIQQNTLKSELWDPLEKEKFSHNSLLLLENLQILELYLWPSFNEDASNFHVLLIALIINIKHQENLPTWSLFTSRPDDFSVLFRRITSLNLDKTLSSRVRTNLLVTLIAAFQSLDSGLIRKECAPLVSISIWHNLHDEFSRDLLLEKNAQFKKAWRAARKRFDGADDTARVRLQFERSWLYNLLLDFLDLLYNTARRSLEETTYCERFLELLIDLQSQFPTRRYVNTLLQDLNLLVATKLSPLYHDEESGLLRDLTELLSHFTYFPMDDQTGRQYSWKEASETHSVKLAQLQRMALKHYREQLEILALANYASLDNRDELGTHLEPLQDTDLIQLATLLGYRTEYPGSIALKPDRSFLLEVLLFAHEKKTAFQETISSMRILPTENSLYNEKVQRNENYNGSHPLAIPRLNLQYLTVQDFLWRSFILYRNESFYEVRKHLEETVKRIQPRVDQATGQIRFSGSSRMAIQITKPAIIEVAPPKVGQEFPAQVKAEITLNMSRFGDNIRREWESIRRDDVIFLLAVNPVQKSRALTNGNTKSHGIDQAGFSHLRCAEVLQVLDHGSRPIRTQNNISEGENSRRRQIRLIVNLDPVAYHADAVQTRKGNPDIYQNINLVVRRRSRENNFKSVLESIRQLILSEVPIPTWLHDVFLGLGDPAGASYKKLPSALKTVDFRDTFLDWEHLMESMQDCLVHPESKSGKPISPPYVLTTFEGGNGVDLDADESAKRPRTAENIDDQPPTRRSGTKSTKKGANQTTTGSKQSRKRQRDEVDDEPTGEIVKVSSYQPPNMGPYPIDLPRVNGIRFTPAQVEAIRSGTQPGLTVVVGPPGTGKTDVATQIINNIYHNFPSERTLLIAHSNQALNQLFQKIAALNIDERHLLRLGHGEEELQLETATSYSKYGRVESFLERGRYFLSEIDRLAKSIQAPGAHGNTCETADYFNSVYIKPLWVNYMDKIKSEDTSRDEIIQGFPFYIYFSDAPQPLFPQNSSREEVVEIALGCYRHVEKIFSELEDIRPFEILRNSRNKANYLLVKEAKIVAMTSTHAAIRRHEIVNLGFHYDNVVMEEAAQITEIENFIPLALQNPKEHDMPLKRIILCGDHLQNSPIVQNLAFRQFANLEQSLFLRLVRLGVPTIMLDKQGRARPSLAELYRWRYPSLGNLPIVETAPEFLAANAGFRYDYQFINVPDYKGKGEMEPTPHFTQNLGEAEYVVALYQYMRLLGYPASKISILTTYSGQRALIRDVLNHRCAGNRLFGMPRIVTTVDKYQGEQNDYVILSLVRTSRIGYLRDIRRLTVALSRARLGLYIFGRREVFEICYELKEAFDRLFKRPDKLRLVTNEMFPAIRNIEEEIESTEMDGVEHLGKYVFEMTQAKIASLKAGTETLPPEERVVIGEDEDDDEIVAEDAEIEDEQHGNDQ